MAEYKRSIFLINPKFQLRFSLIICSLIWISSLVYPMLIIDVFNAILKISPQTAKEIKIIKSELFYLMVGFQLVYVGIVFILCIYLTHKVAGPMYKLTQHLKKISSGEKIERLKFRHGDNFAEVADELNFALEKMADQRDEDFAYIAEVKSYINNLSLAIPEDKKPVTQEIISRLDDIQNRYKSI